MIILISLVTVLVGTASAADEQRAAWDRPLPIGADWALRQNIDLPNPFGVSLFLVTMTRDIEISDVRVTLPGGEPVSVGNVASFDVRNRTTLTALKLDAWVLPLLNLYVLVGQSWTDTRLNAAITVNRILFPPVVIDVTQDAAVGGPLVGAGATVVAGYGHWFIMADANYNYSDIKELAGGIGAWFLSARTGWSGTARSKSWRAWVGAAYLETDRTLTITQESPILGTVVVEVDQRPVNPLTLQAGGSIGFGKRWELLMEAGTNSNDDVVGVFSASYRF
jgi:hypothetical protein